MSNEICTLDIPIPCKNLKCSIAVMIVSGCAGGESIKGPNKNAVDGLGVLFCFLAKLVIKPDHSSGALLLFFPKTERSHFISCNWALVKLFQLA